MDYESITAYELYIGGYGTISLFEMFAKYMNDPDGFFDSGTADKLLTLPAGPERDQLLQDWGLDGFGVDTFKTEVQWIKDSLASEASGADPAATLIERFGTYAKPLSELDESAPASGKYVSDDGTKVITVKECTLEPFTDDSSADSTSSFLIKNSDGSSIDAFASITYTVMKDGNVTITSLSITGYQQDSSGNWRSK
ncbi:hypothetical protein [Actinotignum schaalii]|uniref:hypothetical protein n=1 Tax=Actinotignum schaalii TaxID=59505 RepID=UPI0012B56DCB|nr:hypothetical protein [Actinotignum schaalii]